MDFHHERKNCRFRYFLIASKFDGTQIIQPIYYSTKDHPYYLTNNYIREHSHDFDNGLGEIFCLKDNEVSIMPKGESLN